MTISFALPAAYAGNNVPPSSINSPIQVKSVPALLAKKCQSACTYKDGLTWTFKYDKNQNALLPQKNSFKVTTKYNSYDSVTTFTYSSKDKSYTIETSSKEKFTTDSRNTTSTETYKFSAGKDGKYFTDDDILVNYNYNFSSLNMSRTEHMSFDLKTGRITQSEEAEKNNKGIIIVSKKSTYQYDDVKKLYLKESTEKRLRGTPADFYGKYTYTYGSNGISSDGDDVLISYTDRNDPTTLYQQSFDAQGRIVSETRIRNGVFVSQINHTYDDEKSVCTSTQVDEQGKELSTAVFSFVPAARHVGSIISVRARNSLGQWETSDHFFIHVPLPSDGFVGSSDQQITLGMEVHNEDTRETKTYLCTENTCEITAKDENGTIISTTTSTYGTIAEDSPRDNLYYLLSDSGGRWELEGYNAWPFGDNHSSIQTDGKVKINEVNKIRKTMGEN